MKWSLKVGRLAGIEVYIHATFLILVAWVAAGVYLSHESAGAALETTLFVLLIFLIVVLHELGHALAARRYGIQTKDITLLPIGGVARLNSIPENPSQELVVALAGPLVNLVIAGGIFIGFVIGGKVTRAVYLGGAAGSIMSELLSANLVLAFFNLLPAFPMDGGRVLRALLAFRLGRLRATEVAVSIGHFMALAFGVIGIFGLPGFHANPILVFIAFFIWVGADAELDYVRVHEGLRGVRVADVMSTEFESLRADTTLGQLAERIVPAFQSDFPVIDSGKLVGFISIDAIARGLVQQGAGASVYSFVSSDFDTARPDEPLEPRLAGWQPENGRVIAVLDGSSLVGIVTPKNLMEYMMVHSALSTPSALARPRPR